MYAILLYRNKDNTIHVEILDVRREPNLEWFYDNLQCRTIEHAVRTLYHTYEFIFDEEYLFGEHGNELPIAICKQAYQNEQIMGRMLILPYVEGAEDFVFFSDKTKAEKVKNEILDFFEWYSKDKVNYFSAMKYNVN